MTAKLENRVRERLEAQPAIQRMLANLEQSSLRRAEEAAKADPEKHRLSRVFSGPMRWRYYRTKDGRGTKVRYCYSTVPNVAGYYLVWRERVYKDGRGKRDKWRAVAKRIEAGRLAKAMWEEAGA